MDNRQWRELMDTAMGVPPGRVTVAAVRRRLVRRRVREAVGILAAVVVAVTGVTAAVRVFGAGPGPASHGPAAPTVYAAYVNELPVWGPGGCGCHLPTGGLVIPISTATNKAGKPIRVGSAEQIAITPDGKTAYVLNTESGTVIPVSTATNRAGKPIHVGSTRAYGPFFIAITPDGKAAYVAGTGRSNVVPISTATNTAGKPIPVAAFPSEIAITPDGRTAYVVSNTHSQQHSTVTPISTATNTAGTPILVPHDPIAIAITPDGKTAYVAGGDTVTPISTVTNNPGTPIRLADGIGAFALAPDGKTAYVLTTNPDAVVPISTATNTAGTPIKVRVAPGYFPLSPFGENQLAFTPDGKTAYLVTSTDSVVPITVATNTAGKTIQLGSGCHNYGVFPELSIAISPDSGTVYVACEGAVVPVSTATNTAGKPIPVPLRQPANIAITP